MIKTQWLVQCFFSGIAAAAIERAYRCQWYSLHQDAVSMVHCER